MAAQRTLRELATPNVNQQPLCITYTDTEEAFELKSGLIHLLPTFRGIAGEDPHKHLKEFHVVCSTMRPQGVTEEQIKLCAFPFSLANMAKDWLFYLPSGCPHHQIPDQLLIQYFYEGLLPMDRSMIDAASGGALANKTTDEAKLLISNMAENSQQFGVRSEDMTRRVNEVNHSNLANKLTELTALVRQMTVGQVQAVKVYGICAASEHAIDMCPTLQEDPYEQASAMGGMSGSSQRRNDPYVPTYNPG
ncbi:uncharacterized protein [Coffea arabica]|uniref:Retrotransposon gag domain-containing protein n=1 Tax=Coffea arabica TaxID=13443 RepID=A0ABM4UYQ2_COFAR